MTVFRAIAALALAALLGACATMAGAGVRPATEIRAMTYNIRLDLASDGPNAWPHRKEMLAAVVRHEEPAVLGMQEVLLRQKRDLEAALPEYAFVGVGRDDGAEAGEFSPVGFRRDRFDLLDSGTFWLSPTPTVPGKAWDAGYPRVATWALLRDRTDGRELRVLNTHFDNSGTMARQHSAEMIAGWSRKYTAAGEDVIVMGDLNATPDSPPVTMLSDPAQSGLRAAKAISMAPPYGPPGTFTGFAIDSDAPEPIDHILVSPGLVVRRYAVVTQQWGGRLPSDHYPVVVDLERKR